MPAGIGKSAGAMSKSPAQLLMERETRVSYGSIDLGIFGFGIEPGHRHIDADRYLLRTTAGLDYFYRKGEGITICRGDQGPTVRGADCG